MTKFQEVLSHTKGRQVEVPPNFEISMFGIVTVISYISHNGQIF